MHILLTAMPESPGTFWEQFTGHFQAALENSGVFLADALWALIKVAAIFLAARFTLAVVSRMTRHVMNSARYHRTESGGKRTDTVMTLTRSFSRYLIYSVALVMALVELGVGDLVNNLIVTAGIGSVAIGFGAQSLVKDMVTGFFLMFENQFSVGDYIKVDGQEGYVEATAMRVTYLRTFKGEQIIIPQRKYLPGDQLHPGRLYGSGVGEGALYHGCGYRAGGSASGGRACLRGQPRCDRAAQTPGRHRL